MITQQKAHVMIIEDESTANHIYARNRLYFSVECSLEEDAEKIFQLFDERYGDSLTFLREMKDFRVVRFVPLEKSLVLGFGASYMMDRDGKLQSKSISHS